jgi:hypothetical protein
VTDRFSYFSDEPLFDYSPSGKFKTGSLNVQVKDILAGPNVTRRARPGSSVRLRTPTGWA